MTAMNFNTSNNTLRQLLGNGLMYRVPPFQRDYSWTPNEWDDLWQDIVALMDDDGEPAHYMGYLVLQTTDNKRFDIIDGQQRITTLSLLMLAAIDHLNDLANAGDGDPAQSQRAEQFRSSYIGYLDPVTLVPQSKLALNRHNDGFYQNFLVPLERLPQRGLNASEHLLRKAFGWFKERLKAYAGNDGEKVARFVDQIVDRLFFTVITVADELNAFKVFETLNARGVRLSSTDLLKNYLFSVINRDGAHDTELKTLEERWEAIVGLLGSESFPEFLRVFWNSRNKLVRKAELFKTLRRAINDKAQAFALIRELDDHARIYAALRNPVDDFFDADERACLGQLQMFNVRQPMALLLAAFSHFRDNDRAVFKRLLRAITVVSFRYNVIGGKLTNTQEGVYNDIARRLATGDLNSAPDIIRALGPVYPEDREFKAAFAEKALRTTSSRNKKVVRYTLFELEQHVSGQKFEFDSPRYSIEHVLPENPGDGWNSFDEPLHDRCVYRLGNMTLLAANSNRELGNASFADKLALYRDSEFTITRKIANDYGKWTADTIQRHQLWMAQQAVSIWKIAF